MWFYHLVLNIMCLLLCFRKPIFSKKPAKGKFKNASSHKKSYLPTKASKSYLPTKSSKVYGVLVILSVELEPQGGEMSWPTFC